MTAVVLRRLLRLLVVCFGVSLVTFLLLHLSGDPVAMILPEATEADRATLREALGLTIDWYLGHPEFFGRLGEDYQAYVRRQYQV